MAQIGIAWPDFGLAWFLLIKLYLQAGMILARHGLKIDEKILLTQ
jgi:hypothetical protein